MRLQDRIAVVTGGSSGLIFASDDAAWITGAALSVDGGWLASI